MRRIAAFVVLAGGGLAAIAATSGGFLGTARERPKPVLDGTDDAPGASPARRACA